VASLAPFSGPLRPLGLADLLNLDLGDVHRVGRIIMLYHSLTIPFVAALVYLILDQVPMGSQGEGMAHLRAYRRNRAGLLWWQSQRAICSPAWGA